MSTRSRILLLGGVGLVKGRIRDAGAIMAEICDALDPALYESGFLDRAPFRCLSGIIRFGTVFKQVPDLESVDRESQCLPFSVEVPMADLRRASRDVVKARFLEVVLSALEVIAERHNLSLPDTDELKKNIVGDR